MEINDNIYYQPVETTTSTTTKKVFQYERPKGWDKKENSILRFFRVLYGGITGKDMDASDLRRYEYWKLNFIAAFVATFICAGMMYVITTSPLGKEKYSKQSNKQTYIDMVIEKINEKSTPPPKQKVVIVKDSLVNLDSIDFMIHQSDSILKLYEDTLQ